MTAPNHRRLVDLLEAGVQTEELDQEARTVPLVFTTGAKMIRSTWSDGPYELRLLQPDEGAMVRLGRLNSGRAPLLDAHSSCSNRDVIGVVEKDSVSFDGGKGRALVRLSNAEGDADVVGKILDGIVANVSIGFEVHKYNVTEPEDRTDEGSRALPLWEATDWEPFEISAVPIGADPGGAFFASYNCETQPRQERTMPNRDPQTQPPAVSGQDVDKAVQDALAAERTRVETLHGTAKDLGVPASVVSQLLKDGTSLEEAYPVLIRHRASLDDAPGVSGAQSIQPGQSDELDHIRAGLEAALWHRCDPGKNKLEEVGKRFRSYNLMDMARLSLERAGIDTGPMTPGEMATRALRLQVAAHTPTDFPLALRNVMHKSLRRGYDETPRTFLGWARQSTFRDLRDKHPTLIGNAPDLLPIAPGGEYQPGSIAESQESYGPTKYGRAFLITWETLVNDDMDALGNRPRAFGMAGARLEGDVVYAILTGNPNLADGDPLFDATIRNNVINPGGAPSIAEFDAMQTAIALQTGLGGRGNLNLMGAHIIAPVTLRLTVRQVIRSTHVPITSDESSTPEIEALTPHFDSRLDAASTDDYYMAADPSQVDTVEFAYLEGENGLVTETYNDPDRDSIKTKARLVFGAAPVDFRGLCRNNGGA